MSDVSDVSDASNDIMYIKAIFDWLSSKDITTGGFFVNDSVYGIRENIILKGSSTLIHKTVMFGDELQYELQYGLENGVDIDLDFQIRATLSASEYYSYYLSIEMNRHYHDGVNCRILTSCTNLKEIEEELNPLFKVLKRAEYTIPTFW